MPTGKKHTIVRWDDGDGGKPKAALRERIQASVEKNYRIDEDWMNCKLSDYGFCFFDFNLLIMTNLVNLDEGISVYQSFFNRL